MRSTARQAITLGLSLAMAFGTVPTQALAEAIEEVGTSGVTATETGGTNGSMGVTAGDETELAVVEGALDEPASTEEGVGALTTQADGIVPDDPAANDSVYNELKSAYEQAKADAETAATTLAEKEQAYQDALDALEQVNEEVETERNNLQAAADAAKDELDAAVADCNAKQAAFDQAAAAVTENATAITQAEQDLSAKQTVAAQKANAVTSAQSAATSAQNAYDAATADVITKQEAVDAIVNEAEEKAAQGSVRFFTEQGSDQAAGYVTDTTATAYDYDLQALGTFASFTNVGATTDATGLENMLDALDWIEYCNETYRVPNNLSAFLVTDNMMASAQRNANFSTSYYQHALDASGSMNMAEEGGNAMGENLYVTYIGKEAAYQGWFDDEKAVFDAAVAKDPTLEQYRGDSWALQNVNGELASQVGHYFNIINPSYTVTGLGLNSGTGGAALQQFIHPWDSNPTSAGTTYTVAEYRQRLQEYYDALRGDQVAAAEKQALAEVKAVQAEKKTALDNANTALATAQDEKTAADNAVSAAQTTLDGLNGQTAGLVDARDNAQSELTAAESTVTTKQTAYDNAQSALDAFDGTARIVAAQATADAAKGERDAALANKESLDATYAEAAEALGVAQRLSNDNVTVKGIVDATYDGTEHTQDAAKLFITMSKGDRTQTYELTIGTDYEVEYFDNTNAGTAKMTFTGKGDYAGSITREFSIAPVEVTAIEAIATQTYTGSAIMPKLVVRAGDLALGAGDYAASHKNNTNAGTATVEVTGKGNYTGTATGTFSIARAKVSAPTATNRTYNGKAQTGVAAGAGYALSGTARATNAGAYTATATPDANHCWADGTTAAKSIPWTIAKAASSISLADQGKTYTGKAVAYTGDVTMSGSAGAMTLAYFSDAACTKPVAVANVKNAGTYYVRATLAADANHKAATSNVAKLTVKKAAQPMKLKAVKRTAKASATKKKAVTVAAPLKFTKKAQGTVTYAKVAKGSAKCLTVNKKTGKVTIKRGTKKDTYKVKIKVTAKGDKNYKAGSKTVTCTVVVK